MLRLDTPEEAQHLHPGVCSIVRPLWMLPDRILGSRGITFARFARLYAQVIQDNPWSSVKARVPEARHAELLNVKRVQFRRVRL